MLLHSAIRSVLLPDACKECHLLFDLLNILVDPAGDAHLASAFRADGGRDPEGVFLAVHDLFQVFLLDEIFCFFSAFYTEISLSFSAHRGSFLSETRRMVRTAE